MGIDLKNLTLIELRKLAARVDKAIASAEAKRRKDARAAVDQVAKEYGVSIDDLLTTAKPKPKRAKKSAPKKVAAAPKYRNPSDPTKTWTGKGRRPAWYVEAVAAGRSEEELLA
ncbi:MAG: H-NS histone family protein [Pseudomonadota bacterium]